MNLYRLVYISDRNEKLDTRAFEKVIKSSCQRNASLGISGLLLASEKHFIQVLEGEPMHVRTLYSKIAGDDRHSNVEILSEQNVTGRLFPDWGMESALAENDATMDRDELRKTLIRIRLMSKVDQSQTALSLLQSFRDQLKSKAA